MMKTVKRSVLTAVLSLVLVFSLLACASGVERTGLWKDADYVKDTTLGKGAKTVTVEVKAEEQSVTFTVKTDKTTLGDALLDVKLIAGDAGDYGLYVTSVNGITADFNVNGSYWGFYQDGELLPVGVGGAEIKGGEHFELVYEIYTPAE